MSPLTRTVTAADGTALHVEVHEPEGVEGPVPTVVLVHCWSGTTELWGRVVEALRADVRVLTYDLRGHGRSGGAPETFSVEVLGTDLQAVLEAAAPEGEQVVLVGHSMGAMSVLSWAATHPAEVAQRCRAAVLLSTGTDRLSDEATFVPLPRRFARLQATAQRRVLSAPGPLPARVAAVTTRWFCVARRTSAADVALCARMMSAIAPRARRRWSQVLGDLDLAHAPAHLDVPTTVVVGLADRLTPPTYARRLAAGLPQLAGLVEIDGVGHMTPVEAPDDVVRIVRAATSTAPFTNTATTTSTVTAVTGTTATRREATA